MSHEQNQINWSDWIEFIQEKISMAPSANGVYILANPEGHLYIGQGVDIHQKLKEHLSEDNECIKKTTHYRYAKTEDAGRLEVTLLNQFRMNNSGRLPPCNVTMEETFTTYF